MNWTQITQITDTTYKVDKLKTDSEYSFRVVAVNNIGAGPPSPISEFIRTSAPFDKEKPTIIEPLTDKSIGLDEKLVLSTVIGGIPIPKVTWYKNKTIIETEEITYENRVTKYIIEKTTTETEAEYTCVAENEVGTTETTCRVTVQQKPTITVEDRYINQKLRKGKTYTIKATITGYPEPEITWLRETVSISTDSRVKITREDNEITLEMTDVEREDSGKYTIIVKNNAGDATVDLTLKVIDKPERPAALDVTNIKKDSVVIAWTPPIDDGGLDITKYAIEKCDPDKMVWIKVAEVEKTIISYCVQKLLPNSQYIFRVVAENPIGFSEPIESNPVTIKLKIGKLFSFLSFIINNLKCIIMINHTIQTYQVHRVLQSMYLACPKIRLFCHGWNQKKMVAARSLIMLSNTKNQLQKTGNTLLQPKGIKPTFKSRSSNGRRSTFSRFVLEMMQVSVCH